MHERRFTEPAGDNALLYYRSAAAADASNGEARDGLQRVAGVLAGRFEEALNAGRFEEAAQTLANFKAAGPTDARVATFEQRLFAAEISKALADGNLDRAAALIRRAQAAGSTPAEQLAKWRADIGRRVDGPGVAARRPGRGPHPRWQAHRSRRQRQDLHGAAGRGSRGPMTQRAQHDLGTAYLRKARDAALAKNTAEEDRWLNEARGLGMKQTDILAFQRDVTNARARRRRPRTSARCRWRAIASTTAA